MGRVNDNLIGELENAFEYVTSDIEDIENKEYLKPAIISNMECMIECDKALIRDYVNLVYNLMQ